MISEIEARDLFERRRMAWLNGDTDAYLALWAPEMSFQSPLHQIPLDRLAFEQLIRASASVSRPLRFDVENLAVCGDLVLAEWTIAIERRDQGRITQWSGMSAARYSGGLIVEWREYWNPLLLA